MILALCLFGAILFLAFILGSIYGCTCEDDFNLRFKKAKDELRAKYYSDQIRIDGYIDGKLQVCCDELKRRSQENVTMIDHKTRRQMSLNLGDYENRLKLAEDRILRLVEAKLIKPIVKPLDRPKIKYVRKQTTFNYKQ